MTIKEAGGLHCPAYTGFEADASRAITKPHDMVAKAAQAIINLDVPSAGNLVFDAYEQLETGLTRHYEPIARYNPQKAKERVAACLREATTAAVQYQIFDNMWLTGTIGQPGRPRLLPDDFYVGYATARELGECDSYMQLVAGTLHEAVRHTALFGIRNEERQAHRLMYRSYWDLFDIDRKKFWWAEHPLHHLDFILYDNSYLSLQLLIKWGLLHTPDPDNPPTREWLAQTAIDAAEQLGWASTLTRNALYRNGTFDQTSKVFGQNPQTVIGDLENRKRLPFTRGEEPGTFTWKHPAIQNHPSARPGFCPAKHALISQDGLRFSTTASLMYLGAQAAVRTVYKAWPSADVLDIHDTQPDEPLKMAA